jgi:hypothetical protein
MQIPEGGWFLQSAANSELGRMMISLCKHRGIKSINVVRREEAAQEVLAAGWVLHMNEVNVLPILMYQCESVWLDLSPGSKLHAQPSMERRQF